MHGPIDQVPWTSAPRYPTTMTIAGGLWLGAAGVIVLVGLANVLRPDLPHSFNPPVVKWVGLIIAVVFASTYLKAGLENVQGKATRYLGNVVASIGLGLIAMLYGLAQAATLALSGLVFGTMVLRIGALLIGGAVLTAVGWDGYMRWRSYRAAHLYASPLPMPIAPTPLAKDTAIQADRKVN